MAVVVAAVTIVIATPKFAEPAIGGAPALGSADVSSSPTPAIAVAQGPTSKPPERLKGYKWPLRGGTMLEYFEWDRSGFLTVEGKRINEGLVMSWFEGAWVKAPHKGEVVATGRQWATEAGFEDPMDDVIKKLGKKKRGAKRMPAGVVIDDGNGYHSVITGLKELSVEVGDKVKAGQVIGRMAEACCVRYELVRMDGGWMRVAQTFIERDGYPRYTRERVDPLLVLDLEKKKAPGMAKRPPPEDPPRLDPL
jgi:murein DD-endopeptidase MepM/ murein hydrolase activator NlpD